MILWMLTHSNCPFPSSLRGAGLNCSGRDLAVMENMVAQLRNGRRREVLEGWSAPQGPSGVGTERKREHERTSVSRACVFVYTGWGTLCAMEIPVNRQSSHSTEQCTEHGIGGQTDRRRLRLDGTAVGQHLTHGRGSGRDNYCYHGPLCPRHLWGWAVLAHPVGTGAQL